MRNITLCPHCGIQFVLVHLALHITALQGLCKIEATVIPAAQQGNSQFATIREISCVRFPHRLVGVWLRAQKQK